MDFRITKKIKGISRLFLIKIKHKTESEKRTLGMPDKGEEKYGLRFLCQMCKKIFD